MAFLGLARLFYGYKHMPSKLRSLLTADNAYSALEHIGPSSFKTMGAGAGLWPVKNAFNLAIAGNIHDLPNLIFAKSNKGGRKIQRMILADSIVAAKAATEGKVFANRKPLGLWLGSTEMPKAIAIHEANLVAQNLPHGKFGLLDFSNNNKLNIPRLKKVLSGVGALDKGAFAAQIAVPMGLATNNYVKARQHGDSQKDSFKAALRGGALGGAISAGLILPRKFIRGASYLHNTLSQDANYGYDLLDSAASDAAKVINSPRSYYKHLYAKPEDNLKAFPGKFTGDTFKRILGQTTAKGYDREAGYFYKERGADLPFAVRVKNKLKRIAKEATHV